MQQQSIGAARIGCRFHSLSLQKCSERFLMHIPVLPPIHHSPSSSRVTPHVRLIVLATRGVMEILGLVPYQSQTQYLEGYLRVTSKRKYSGNIFPLYFLFVSTSRRFCRRSGNIEGIYFHSCFHFKSAHRQWRQELQCQGNPIDRS
jgi:hypothetical protein